MNDDDDREDEVDDGDKPDGRRRRSLATNERKQAFGRKNEKLNKTKVIFYAFGGDGQL